MILGKLAASGRCGRCGYCILAICDAMSITPEEPDGTGIIIVDDGDVS